MLVDVVKLRLEMYLCVWVLCSCDTAIALKSACLGVFCALSLDSKTEPLDLNLTHSLDPHAANTS